MIRPVLLCAVLAACGPSAREQDCAEVRKILEAPNPTGMPRRYWDYAPKQGEAAIVDMSPLDRLRKLDYRDGEVRDAVKAYVNDTGWTVYSPYSTEADMASSKGRLAKLCGLQQTIIVQ
jgi:hypothetical protein